MKPTVFQRVKLIAVLHKTDNAYIYIYIYIYITVTILYCLRFLRVCSVRQYKDYKYNLQQYEQDRRK